MKRTQSLDELNELAASRIAAEVDAIADRADAERAELIANSPTGDDDPEEYEVQSYSELELLEDFFECGPRMAESYRQWWEEDRFMTGTTGDDVDEEGDVADADGQFLEDASSDDWLLEFQDELARLDEYDLECLEQIEERVESYRAWWEEEQLKAGATGDDEDEEEDVYAW